MALILLTNNSPALIEAARSALPGAEVRHLDQARPETFETEAWCFVDWLLDSMSGLELCRRLRACHKASGLHITMVLDGDDDNARARAVEAGADDYMPGPLTPQALSERIRYYSSGNDAQPAQPAHGGLTLDIGTHTARWQGVRIPLRPREVNLLEMFIANPDRLLSRTSIIEKLASDGEVGDERTVDVWVGRLRRTLEAHGVRNVLRTVRSLGYVFDLPNREGGAKMG